MIIAIHFLRAQSVLTVVTVRVQVSPVESTNSLTTILTVDRKERYLPRTGSSHGWEFYQDGLIVGPFGGNSPLHSTRNGVIATDPILAERICQSIFDSGVDDEKDPPATSVGCRHRINLLAALDPI